MAGEDYSAVENCKEQTKKRLYFIGFVVCLIFLLSFTSILEAFSELFNSFWFGLIVGLFFGWVIVNMYLLLLYTLARNVLAPDEVKSRSTLSYYIRLGTMVFFAIVVSKPIEHFLFSEYVNTEIEVYKAEKLRDLRQSLFTTYSKRIKDSSALIDKETIIKERNAIYAHQKMLISESNYYTLSLKFLNKRPHTWVVTLLITSLFVWPIYLKRVIEPDSPYYRRKFERKSEIIRSHYLSFKKEYNKTIRQFTNEELSYSEPFKDAPLNYYIKTTEITYNDEESFLSSFYE